MHRFGGHHDLRQEILAASVAVAYRGHGGGEAVFDDGIGGNAFGNGGGNERSGFFFFSAENRLANFFKSGNGGSCHCFLCFFCFRRPGGLDKFFGAFVVAQKEAAAGEGFLDVFVERIHDGGVHAAGKGHGEEGGIDLRARREAEGNIARAHDGRKAECLAVALEREERLACGGRIGRRRQDEGIQQQIFAAKAV